MTTPVFAIVEQMGHVRFGARCVEENFAGASMLKCEVLAPEEGVLAVRRINGSSLYAFTECDEATARAANKNRWEVSRAVPSLPSSVIDAVETHDPFEDEEADEHCETPEQFAEFVQSTVAELRTEIAHANLRPSVRALYELNLDALEDRAEQELHAANDNAIVDPNEYSYGDPPDEETVVEALSLVEAFTADDVPSLAFVHEQVSRWSDEQRFAAWNWAIRLHLNDPEAYPIPSRPPHIDALLDQPSTTSSREA